MNKIIWRVVGIWGLWVVAVLGWALPVERVAVGQSAVVDVAGVIEPMRQAQLEARLQRWAREGVMQAAVVVVDSTQGLGVFDYALALAERWQLGGRESDEGLLLLVAIEERDLQVLTGYGLEGALPDVSVKRIITEQITPAFKVGDYAGGIELGLQAMATRLLADDETQQRLVAADKAQVQQEVAGDWLALIVPAVIIATVLSQFLGRILAGFLGGVGTVGVLSGMGGVSLWLALVLGLAVMLVVMVPAFVSGGNAVVVGRLPSGYGDGFGGRMNGRRGGGGYRGGGGGFGGGGAGGSW